MKLYKPWVWRENAIMYDHPSKVVHEPYPFYWYRETGNEIELVKQISAFCGVVQDWNHYVKEESFIYKVDGDILDIEEMYIDHRSWLTLGDIPYNPIDQISTFIWGNKKVQLSYTPDGQLFERKEWMNNQIVYKSNVEFKRVKDRYFAKLYENTDGVKTTKLYKTWHWAKGKPMITKKQYGTH